MLRWFVRLLSFLVLVPIQIRAADTRLPNIVLVMADDLGYGDPGCYNADSKIPTPNIDRLAKEGLRFTDAHTPSAVCTPTRYGLLTGRYSWRTSLKSGVLWGFSPALIEPGRVTLASLLKDRGYATACVGKWHLGLGTDEKTDYSKPLRPGPLEYGFDYFFGIPASLDMEPYVYVENDGVLAEPTETIEASQHRRQNGVVFWRGGPIAPGFRHIDVLPKITEKALSWIEQQAGSRERPFFLYFPLTAPHTPWLPTDEFRGRSGAGYYGDFAVQVDSVVGRVLDSLKLSENTLVIFTSDNGAHWYPNDVEQFGHSANGPLRGQKADIWDGGHRVAFLARWPGRIAAGGVSDQLICHTDVLAMLAEIVGTELPENAGEDSISFLPALTGQNAAGPARDAVVHHSAQGVFAIRQGKWKLIVGRGSGGFSEPRRIQPAPGEPTGQLYDLESDLAEENNLYLERPEIVKRLTALLEQCQRDGRTGPQFVRASRPD